MRPGLPRTVAAGRSSCLRGFHLTARLGSSPEMELCVIVRVYREISFVYKGLSHTE